MTVIVGELVATGDRIALVAGGLGDDVEAVAQAARHLKTLTPLFAKSDPPGALMAPATWATVVQLAATFGDAWRPGPALQAWIAAETAARMNPAEPVYTPPAGLTTYPWQVAGARMIAATGSALITDEPGTGKTITAILGVVERSALLGHKALGVLPVLDRPCVVVCPASVVDPWVEAWQTWAPHVRTVAWRGTPTQRQNLAGTADVYVTSYETARQDAGPVRSTAKRSLGPLYDLEPAHLVIDECHLIKNPQAARTKAVLRLAKNARTVVALSGTPITHHPGDLWPALNALDAESNPSRERWITRYCQVVPGDYKDEILGLRPEREPEFRLSLLGQHRRVAKADVLTQLPPKVYSVRTVELPTKWRKAYDDMERQMLAELPDGEELSVMGVLAQMTRLAQLASAAAKVETTTETGEDGAEKVHTNVTLEAPSWKVDALLEVLAERPGEPVVCFAPSRQLIMLAGRAAEAEGYRVGYVVGNQSQADRTAAVAKFQAGELDLICVTTGAGGVGLTLTAAKTCVFLQRPWSIVEAMQAEDRCHRIGSEVHDAIEVIDVVAKNTIDTRVRAVLRERAGQLADLVQDPRILAELLGGSKTSPGRSTAIQGAEGRPTTAPSSSREDVPAAPGPFLTVGAAS